MTAQVVDDLDATPAHINIPPRDGSLVHAVAAVAAKVGRTLDPAQHLAVDVLTSSWSDGRPASLEAVVICPRQNLKTYCLELIVLTRLLRRGGDQLAVWSAHEVATAQETFRNILALAEQHPWLERQIASVSRATGREGIEFVGGRRLRFRARVKTGGRGLAGDLIVLDEAFALQPTHMGSLLPILSTRPRGQVIFGSSAPLAGSDVLRDAANRGRAAAKGAPAYIEWSAPGSFADPGCTQARCNHDPGTPGCVLDDEAMWTQANPAAVYGRISMDYLRAERLALQPDEFARERLGWWTAIGSGASPIEVGQWQACADLTSSLPGRPVFAVSVSRDLRSAAIAAAGRREDGLAHVELIEHRAGTDWLMARVGELAGHEPLDWIVDPKTATAAFLPDFARAGIEPVEMRTTDVGQACSSIQAAVADGQLRHLGDPILTAAVDGAARRDIGDGLWAWAPRRSEVDIVTLVAATNALWGLEQQPAAMVPLVAWR